jgi:hypothetical protein
MLTNLFHLLIALFAGAIATYDTLRSRKKSKEEPGSSEGIFKLQN